MQFNVGDCLCNEIANCFPCDSPPGQLSLCYEVAIAGVSGPAACTIAGDYNATHQLDYVAGGQSATLPSVTNCLFESDDVERCEYETGTGIGCNNQTVETGPKFGMFYSSVYNNWLFAFYGISNQAGPLGTQAIIEDGHVIYFYSGGGDPCTDEEIEFGEPVGEPGRWGPLGKCAAWTLPATITVERILCP